MTLLFFEGITVTGDTLILQTMTYYEKTKRNQGFTDPLDESPIDTPDGWYHGSVVQTGGMIMCRIWRTVEDSTNTTDTYYECAYNTDNKMVSISEYTYDSEYGYHSHNGMIDEIRADSRQDQDLAKAAKELMERHNQSD